MTMQPESPLQRFLNDIKTVRLVTVLRSSDGEGTGIFPLDAAHHLLFRYRPDPPHTRFWFDVSAWTYNVVFIGDVGTYVFSGMTDEAEHHIKLREETDMAYYKAHCVASGPGGIDTWKFGWAVHAIGWARAQYQVSLMQAQAAKD